MDKYQPLRDAGTNGANFNIDTDDVIAHLRGWDTKYGISLENVEHDSVFITFNTLPDDVAGLAADIYEFCPDTVDQHFGCLREVVELAEETGEDVPPEVLELIHGVDLNDDNCGVELLCRSMAKNKSVALWWD